ncbi:hypothetical protein M422DRAFT_65254 [Sphaerobolus stellatus SS14]|nr:hypothetical protein M422DRAFT_65254 [Sphaerobolus stellatus SS14]
MSARRQSSTTSLQRYARSQQVNDAELANRSLDFCNAFWGIADGGYDVLLARIRGAVRTTEELRSFWKERASIEEDYAKRMARLAKQSLGKDELGALRNSIDILRQETERQAASHANLAQLIRKDVEHSVSELLSKQAQFKRTSWASVEKSFKAKQTQETYVKKARQKYEDDCVRINSYTAQSTLVQGKELEKIQLKLEKAQQTVMTNEREYSQYARALADTTNRWEKEWKAFCDLCQDMEEDRIEFFKDNIWAYANSVSTVCVSDDESCEQLRVALEQVEADKDVENFVRDYSTGPQIPDPPPYVDYNSPHASQQSSRLTYRTAKFVRSTNRSFGAPYYPSASPAQEEEPIGAGQAGIGAVGIQSTPAAAPASRPASIAVKASPVVANGTPSVAPSPTVATPSSIASPTTTLPTTVRSFASTIPAAQPSSSQATSPSTSISPAPFKPVTPASFKPQNQDARNEPIVPALETMLKIGDNAYHVNVGQDPQQARASTTAPVANVGGQDDPLARHLEELRSAPGSVRTGNGPARRGTIGANATAGGSIPQPAPTPVNHAPTSSITRSPSPAPGAPTAKFMQPLSNRSASPLPVEDVVQNYQQHLPGEVSRQNSVNRGRQPAQQAHQGNASLRGVSPAREGFAGIGAGSRSPSPLPISRSVSPAPSQQQQQQQRHLGYSAPTPQQGPARATSPFGIELDHNGRVAHDEFAERMYGQPQQGRGSYHGPGSTPQHQALYDGHGQNGTPGYTQGVPQRQYTQQTPQPHAGAQNYYNLQRNNTGLYNPHQPPQPTRQGSVNVPPPNVGYAVPPPPPIQQQPQQQPGSQSHLGYGYDHQGYAPQSHGYVGSNGYQQHDYGGYQQQQQQPPQQQQQPFRAVSPAPPSINRSPSPAVGGTTKPPPTGQYTEAGEPILFYVKALYEYQATIDEEFDFQAGDIIAVTATPEDGWWSGELLDESRRMPGKTIFPSNFVSLF